MVLQNGWYHVGAAVAALLVVNPPDYTHHYPECGSVSLSFQQVRMQSWN